MKARCSGCSVVAVGQPFDGADRLALRLHREHQAGAHRLAVDDHRAGAADAVLAADVRAGQAASSRIASTSVLRGSTRIA